jgi:hypothetical protein
MLTKINVFKLFDYKQYSPRFVNVPTIEKILSISIWGLMILRIWQAKK